MSARALVHDAHPRGDAPLRLMDLGNGSGPHGWNFPRGTYFKKSRVAETRNSCFIGKMKSFGSCARCGVEIPPRLSKGGRQKLYCEEHAPIVASEQKAAWVQRRAEKARAARLLVYGPFLPSKRDRQQFATAAKQALGCRNCGEELIGRRTMFCCSPCRSRHVAGLPPAPKPVYLDLDCPECGSSFRQKAKSQMFCSGRCGKRNKDRIRTKLRRSKQPDGERLDPIRVFERDGWRCQLCFVKTPRSLMGKQWCNSPTLDHIVPLSKGGEHSYRNTQCACHHCNTVVKRDREMGQLRLFG